MIDCGRLLRADDLRFFGAGFFGDGFGAGFFGAGFFGDGFLGSAFGGTFAFGRGRFAGFGGGFGGDGLRFLATGLAGRLLRAAGIACCERRRPGVAGRVARGGDLVLRGMAG